MANRRIRRTAGEAVFNVANILFLCIICFVTVFPFWYVLMISLNDGRDTALGGIYFYPRKPTLANYQYVLSQRAMRTAYRNTLLRTAIGSVLCLLVSGLTAYSMTKKNLPGRNAVLTYFMIPMFIGGTIVSSYVIIAKLGLLDNFLVYVIPGAFNFFYMIIIRTFMQGIPISLEESAKIDGASYYRIFFQIVLPLCMPVVATVLLFSGVTYWLDFYTNLLYIAKSNLMVAQYLLYNVVRANRMNELTAQQAWAGGQMTWQVRSSESPLTSESVKMTVLMVVTLPILVVYPFLQKYFIKGVLIGALKG
jgi:putative aldouronate transport system permease protein